MREACYGFFPGGDFDPRDFDPDVETNTPAELDAHRRACEAAARGEWLGSPLGGRRTDDGFEDGHAFGLGGYYVEVPDGAAALESDDAAQAIAAALWVAFADLA